MKNTILTTLNGLPMAALILLYKFRPDMTPFIIISWVLILIVNSLLLHKVWHLIKMNLFLIFTSVIGVYANNQLYYSFVYMDAFSKNAVLAEVTDTIFLLTFLGILSVILRITLIYVKRHLSRLKDKKYRIIKISGDALYELLYEHFIEKQEEYMDIKKEETVYDFSIDWKNKSFIFAVREEHDSKNQDFELDLSALHNILPDTTKSMFDKKPYQDYYKKELINMK